MLLSMKESYIGKRTGNNYDYHFNTGGVLVFARNTRAFYFIIKAPDEKYSKMDSCFLYMHLFPLVSHISCRVASKVDHLKQFFNRRQIRKVSLINVY